MGELCASREVATSKCLLWKQLPMLRVTRMDRLLPLLPPRTNAPTRELLQHLCLPSRVPRECNESLAGLELRSTLLAQWSEEAWAPLSIMPARVGMGFCSSLCLSVFS